MTGDEARRLLAEGIHRFNSRDFWDAHESWEALWLDAVEPEKTFLQGLIQLAAACHHFQRGTLSGGVRLADASAEKLSAYPHGYMGIDRRAAVEAGLQAREEAAGLIAEGRKDAALSDHAFAEMILR